jgi:hypothetical protein
MNKAIDRLFQRLGATYGAAWDRSFGEAPISDVKTVWAHELSVFSGSLNRIAWALENLPERCPNAMEFKSLCRQAPSPDQQALPEPKADPARVAAELAKLAPIRNTLAASTVAPKDCKAWARKILAEHKAGIRRTPTALQMAKNALSAE